MKLSKTGLIETVRIAIGSQYEIETVQRTIARNLPLLRGLYRENREIFDIDEVAFLRQARSILIALDTYLELAAQWADDAEIDVAALFDELVELKHQLGHVPCCDQLNSLLLEVEQRSDFNTARRAVRGRSVDRVASQIPSCSCCGQLMVPRHSKYGEFWGCARFPDCWGRRSVDQPL